MTDRAFDDAARRAFARAYPEEAVRLDHRLADHRLLDLAALVELAGRLPAANVEYNLGDLPIGIDPTATPGNGLTIADTIRQIEHCRSWMVLKFIETDPLYRRLLDDLLAELEPIVTAATGPMLRKQGFVFISSPDAVTPFHFDPEHNILLQVRGEKTMTVFPADDETVVSGRTHEAFHTGAHRNLPWRDDIAAKGRPVTLAPGQAIHVPVKTPHWVKNGPAPSVSLSITWRSAWSFAEGDARGLNHLLRRAGFNPAAPGRYPVGNHAKAFAYRLLRKARLTPTA